MFSYLKKNFFKIKVYLKKRKEISSFEESFIIFKSNLNSEFMMNSEDRVEYLFDATITTEYDRHYIYHPSWAARVLAKTMPELHYDISSILYFGSIVSAFIPIKYFDYRPANLLLSNYSNSSADLLNLPFDNNSIKSISCMHTIEHIGLGRYGDPIDSNGDIKAIKELIRILAPGGNLLIVVPVGKTCKIIYNAHRIYNPKYILKQFEVDSISLVEFVLIPENENDGGLLINPSDEIINLQNYGCGCFWFKKNN